MTGLLNGAGVLVAISALPMLGGVILAESALAVWLRRIAIVLAIALPAVFMLMAALVYLPRSNTAFFDFSVNFNAAQGLYQHGTGPYTIAGAYSFPFPTFYLYWLASFFGGAGETSAWVVWWFANAGLWILCAAVLWRSMTPPASPRMRDALLYSAVAVPAVTTLWQGQTALCILIGLVIVHWAIQESQPVSSSRWRVMLAGSGLAWAMLIKPQLALVGAGIAVWGILQARRGDEAKAKQTFMILAVSVIVAGFLVIATLILPWDPLESTCRHASLSIL